MRHVPVLLNEIIELLELKSGMNVIDCTLGDAGHAEEILKKTAPNGKLLGIDADPDAILRAKQFLYSFGQRVIFARDNFRYLKKIIQENNFQPINAVLLDLGWSASQFAERGRGFSFANPEEPLDMRYFSKNVGSAADVLNTRNEKELVRIFKDLGEEKYSKRIAEAIIEKRREGKEFRFVKDLVEVVLEVYRKKLRSDKEVPWIGGLHPATKIFQALRIEVNRELESLEQVLPQAVEALAPNGRLAVISFHSLEDRIVKHFFKKLHKKNLLIINKKPLVCGAEEYESNPRARSAKLRVAQKN